MLRRCSTWLVVGCLLGVLVGAVMGRMAKLDLRQHEARGAVLEAELATLAEARTAVTELKKAREELARRQAVAQQLQRSVRPDLRLYHLTLGELTRHSGLALESYRWRNAELSLTVRAPGEAALERFAELSAADPRVEPRNAEAWKRHEGDDRHVLELRWLAAQADGTEWDAVDVGGGS